MERLSSACSQHQSPPIREMHHVSTTFQRLWKTSISSPGWERLGHLGSLYRKAAPKWSLLGALCPHRCVCRLYLWQSCPARSLRGSMCLAFNPAKLDAGSDNLFPTSSWTVVLTEPAIDGIPEAEGRALEDKVNGRPLFSPGRSHFTSVCFLPGIRATVDHFGACPRAAGNTAKTQRIKRYKAIAAVNKGCHSTSCSCSCSENHHSHPRG